MRRHPTTCTFTAFILVALLAATAAATNHRFVESFNTKQYCDKVNTTALWDTVAGQIKLPTFQMTLTGTYNTAGNARGIAFDGNYAYVADYSAGLQIINITNPASPTFTATYDTPGNAKAVAVDGNYAYVADYATGLVIVNITTPAAPTLAGTYDTPGSARDVAIDGNYAYVADYASGLIVVNISNPASPTLAGSYDTPGQALGVAVDGNYAYVADGTAGLQVINITNPASPTLAGTYDTPGTASDVAIAGDRAYVADYGSGLQVINIATPATPTFAGGLSTPENAYSIAVESDFAYIADSAAGILMIGIATPSAPVLLYTYDTPGTAYGVAVDGNQAFVADDVWGMQVVRVSFPRNPISMGPMCTTGGDAFDIAISGDYAYIATNVSGLRVVDISLLGWLTVAGGYATPDYAQGVAIAGDYAYVADANAGIIVLNITNPASPTLAGSYNTAGTAISVAVAGDYAYVADGIDGLVVLNISNPANPTIAGSYNTPYSATDVAIAGDYAYVVDWSSGVLVINITNPASPTLAGSYDTPGEAADIAVAGDYAYVADLFSGLEVLNITNPASPTLAGSCSTPGPAIGVALSGDHAYVADGSSGLQVVDISSPTHPHVSGSFDLPSDANDVAAFGDVVLVADGASGLKAVSVSERYVETPDNAGRSTIVGTTPQNMLKLKLATVQVDSVIWEASANGGTNWQAVSSNGAWLATSTPGTSLLWRNTIKLNLSSPPSCSQLQLDWLYAPAIIDSIRDIPGDQGGRVRVSFSRSAYDFGAEATPITTYNVWRRVDNAAMLEAAAAAKGAEAAALADADDGGGMAAAASGKFGDLPVFNMGERLFMVSNPSLQAAGFPAGTWEVMGSFSATQQDEYIYPTLTLADSTVDGMAYAVYMVTAHTATPSTWYASAPDSGYSVDNLAPHVPTSFAVAYNSGAGNNLSWDVCPDYDFEYFKVYRSLREDFVPGPGNLVHTTIDASWLDTAENGYQYHYKIAAVDHAGNESAAAAPGIVTGIDSPATPKAFALHQNVPNPFNPTTTIRFDLPVAAVVKLAVYNVNGQMIRILANGPMPAGAREVIWDGRDAKGRPAASGIYFYRLDAGRFAQTRKMILLR